MSKQNHLTLVGGRAAWAAVALAAALAVGTCGASAAWAAQADASAAGDGQASAAASASAEDLSGYTGTVEFGEISFTIPESAVCGEFDTEYNDAGVMGARWDDTNYSLMVFQYETGTSAATVAETVDSIARGMADLAENYETVAEVKYSVDGTEYLLVDFEIYGEHFIIVSFATPSSNTVFITGFSYGDEGTEELQAIFDSTTGGVGASEDGATTSAASSSADAQASSK